jgi:hypothetical protein
MMKKIDEKTPLTTEEISKKPLEALIGVIFKNPSGGAFPTNQSLFGGIIDVYKISEGNGDIIRLRKWVEEENKFSSEVIEKKRSELSDGTWLYDCIPVTHDLITNTWRWNGSNTPIPELNN